LDPGKCLGALRSSLGRCIYSAAFGLQMEIHSIRQALVLLGVGQVRKWRPTAMRCGTRASCRGTFWRRSDAVPTGLEPVPTPRRSQSGFPIARDSGRSFTFNGVCLFATTETAHDQRS
jgi:hypothetical protein